MKIVSIGIAAASLLTGLAGAGVAYELTTVDSAQSAVSTPAPESPAASPGAKAERRVRWKPCRPPAVREGRACVTEEVRLVEIGGGTASGQVAVARRDDDGSDRDDFGDRDDRDNDFDDDDHGEDHDDDFDDHGDDDSDDDSDSDHDDDDDEFDDDHSGSGSGDDDDRDDD
jgi:hypothetical protein